MTHNFFLSSTRLSRISRCGRTMSCKISITCPHKWGM